MAVETIAMIAAPMIANAIGGLFGSADKERANKLTQEAQAEIDAIGAPPDVAKEIILNKFKSAGMYKPEMEQAIELGQSKVEQIRSDPSLRDAQINVLSELKNLSQTGIGAQDRAALNKIRSESARSQQAKQQQILQDMQQRGMATSGAATAAALMASQEGANAESEAADRVAAQASQRALESLMKSGELSGNLRNQDFSQDETRARAGDEISRFNVQNSISRQQRNVGASNQGQQLNLANDQDILNRNTSASNAELNRQRDAQMQAYNAKMQAANMKANAKIAGANIARGNAANTQQSWSNIGSAVGQGASAIQSQNRQDALEKKQDARDERMFKILEGVKSTSKKAIPTEEEFEKQ